MFAARSLLVVSAILVSAGCGGGGSSGPSVPTPPLVTAVGTPIGGSINQVVGAAGGEVVSVDGVLSVAIPPGALSSDLTIGIVPITVESPGGVRAYRLTPEGTQFAAPVTIAFSYTQADVAGSAPEFLWIASQQGDGTWLMAPGVALDTLQGMLSVQTTHFSDWTQLQGLQIRPPEGSLKPGESIALQVVVCSNIVETSGSNFSSFAIDCQPSPVSASGDDLPALPPAWRVDAASWAANGIRGGSSAVGFVAGQDNAAQYIAPANAPSGNPVAVSVKIRKRSTGAVLSTVVSNIEIVPICGPAARAPGAAAALIDVCSNSWGGTSSTVFTDAVPTYKLEATLDWVFDTAATAAQPNPNVLVYYASGVAKLTPFDTCTGLSQNQASLGRNVLLRGGELRIDYGPATPTYTGTGAAQWIATVSDLCNPDATPAQQLIGGAFFIGEGELLLPPDYTRIAGSQSVRGQTFTFEFTRTTQAPTIRSRSP
ncbi:MAG: hypothetical protein U0133_11760 [Gemmatimonadales bacterium]